MFIKPCIFESALDNNKFVLWPTMFTMIVWISHALGNIFDSLFDIYKELFIHVSQTWRRRLYLSTAQTQTVRFLFYVDKKTILERAQKMTCTSKHRLNMIIQFTYTFWDKRVSQVSRSTYCQSQGAPSTWHAVWALHSDLLNRASVEHVLPKRPNQEPFCATRVLQRIRHQHRSTGRASQAAISFKRVDCGKHCGL